MFDLTRLKLHPLTAAHQAAIAHRLLQRQVQRVTRNLTLIEQVSRRQPQRRPIKLALIGQTVSNGQLQCINAGNLAAVKQGVSRNRCPLPQQRALILQRVPLQLDSVRLPPPAVGERGAGPVQQPVRLQRPAALIISRQ